MQISLLQMNVIASIVIVASVILRALALYKLPKWVFLCFWGIAALRLLVPFSVPVYVDMGSAEETVIEQSVQAPAMVQPEISAVPPSEVTVPDAVPKMPWLSFESIWIAGTCIAALYFALAYYRLRREFQMAKPCKHETVIQWMREHPTRRPVEIRQTDCISAPMAYGLFRPVVLLPRDTDWEDRDRLHYYLAHEFVHIRRFDALAKLALAAAACVHWFNPLVWVMVVLANRDMELACDEAVLRELGAEHRKAYSNMLIGLAEAKTRMAFPMASYFGKNAVEERITAAMKMRKYGQPLIFLVVSCALLIGAVAAVNLTERAGEELLFAGLSAEDAETITGLLEEQGVEYRLEDGADLYVPEEQAAKLKAQLLMQGYPKDGYTEAVYFEDNASMSEGDREAAFLISLQNRLEETIRMFEGVEDAAVVIDQKSEAASVLLTMADGQEPTSEQVAAIHKLVSNAMPKKLRYIAITTSDGDVVKAEDPTYISPEYSENLRSRAEAEFGIDLSGMEFVSFSYLWNTNDDELPQEHEPLKTMLMDEVLVSHTGEGTPDGVYLDGEDAYMVRGVGNNQVRLVHCKIGGSNDWEQGQEDEEGRMFNGYNYTVVSVETSDTPMGEVGSATYSEYEVVPGGVVGVEGHTDLPEYVEDPADGSVMLGSVIYPEYEIASGGAVGVEGNSDLDGYTEERPVPIQLISRFSRSYSHDYTLIDEMEFSLTAANPSAIYEGESKKDVVVSFEDNGPVTCAVTIVGGTNAGTYKCGFSSEGAIRIDLQGSSSYKVEYQLGVKANHGPPGYIDETVDASSGIIKVYEAK